MLFSNTTISFISQLVYSAAVKFLGIATVRKSNTSTSSLHCEPLWKHGTGLYEDYVPLTSFTRHNRAQPKPRHSMLLSAVCLGKLRLDLGFKHYPKDLRSRGRANDPWFSRRVALPLHHRNFCDLFRDEMNTIAVHLILTITGGSTCVQAFGISASTCT